MTPPWRGPKRPNRRQTGGIVQFAFVSAVDACWFHLNAGADDKTYPRLHLQKYTDSLVCYIDKLITWGGLQAGQGDAYGTSLAVRVVQALLGPEKAGNRRRQKKGGEPLWLRLKWGIAIASRAFDVWSAPSSLPNVDMVSGIACAHCRFGVLARKV